MQKLDFFIVDQTYINFIQQAETKERGFTRVPNMSYPNRPKLACGVVLSTVSSQYNYYVGLTSYCTQRSENILITTREKYKPVKGSLRFNYMFPIPKSCVTKKEINLEQDEKYKQLLIKEYRFIQSNTQRIITMASDIYDKVCTANCSQNLIVNSCDFKLLERACQTYTP